MTIANFTRLKLGTGLTGTSLGSGVIELAATAPTPTTGLLATLHGPLPGSVGYSGMFRVPYRAGAAVTFTLTRAELHLEHAGSTTTQLVIEKSAESSSGFIATTVATLTLTSGSHDTAVTTSLGTLVSGDLLRYRWVSLGAGAANFYAQLEGTG